MVVVALAGGKSFRLWRLLVGGSHLHL